MHEAELEVATGMNGVVVVVATLVVSSALGLWLQRSGRRVAEPPRGDAAPGPRLDATDLGRPLGERATLVQFSTAFCQPCRATRRVLDDIAGQVSGVAHVEVDAESRLDLVRQLGIRRTPTVLVLDGEGLVVRRASGQPRKVDVIAALGAVPE